MRIYFLFISLSAFLFSTSLGWADAETWMKPVPMGSDKSEDQEPSLSEREEAPPKEVIYSFLQGFPEANARKLRKGKFVRGWWQEEGFRFEDSTNQNMMDIFLSERMNVGARKRNAIWFLIGAGYESLLTFQNVPPGKRLKLSYALPDEAFAGKSPAFIRVEVRIGKKRLFESQINTKGWKQKKVDLTLPFLLHQTYDVTIAVRSLDPNPQLLGLYGYIE